MKCLISTANAWEYRPEGLPPYKYFQSNTCQFKIKPYLCSRNSGCSSARLEYASGGRVVAGSNPVTPTGKKRISLIRTYPLLLYSTSHFPTPSLVSRLSMSVIFFRFAFSTKTRRKRCRQEFIKSQHIHFQTIKTERF